MSDEKLASIMGDARLISASENIIYPLIELKINQRLNMACGKFVGGKTDFIADIAYIQGLKEIKQELLKLQKTGNQAAFELTKSNIK